MRTQEQVLGAGRGRALTAGKSHRALSPLESAPPAEAQTLEQVTAFFTAQVDFGVDFPPLRIILTVHTVSFRTLQRATMSR